MSALNFLACCQKRCQVFFSLDCSLRLLFIPVDSPLSALRPLVGLGTFFCRDARTAVLNFLNMMGPVLGLISGVVAAVAA